MWDGMWDVGCGMWDVDVGCGMWDVDVGCGMWDGMWDVMWDVGWDCVGWDCVGHLCDSFLFVNMMVRCGMYICTYTYMYDVHMYVWDVGCRMCCVWDTFGVRAVCVRKEAHGLARSLGLTFPLPPFSSFMRMRGQRR